VLSVIPSVPRKTIAALHVTGDPGSILHVSYADNLVSATSWQALDTITLTNPPQLYFDVADPLPAHRFYRAWQTNVPSERPALDVGMATEVTLTGAVGSKLRVDYINQIGPTNAWVALDTVTLSNTVQPYFDVTMWRQPLRLYRFVPVP
jgi:hypothetical protein